MQRIEAGLIQKAMREPWEKLSFAFTLNLLTLVISWFSGTLWLLFAVSLIVDVLVSLQALVQKARVKRFVQTLELNDSYPVCRQADNTFFLPKKLISGTADRDCVSAMNRLKLVISIRSMRIPG